MIPTLTSDVSCPSVRSVLLRLPYWNWTRCRSDPAVRPHVDIIDLRLEWLQTPLMLEAKPLSRPRRPQCALAHCYEPQGRRQCWNCFWWEFYVSLVVYEVIISGVRYLHLLWKVLTEHRPPGALFRCGVQRRSQTWIYVDAFEQRFQLRRPSLVFYDVNHGRCGWWITYLRGTGAVKVLPTLFPGTHSVQYCGFAWRSLLTWTNIKVVAWLRQTGFIGHSPLARYTHWCGATNGLRHIAVPELVQGKVFYERWSYQTVLPRLKVRIC